MASHSSMLQRLLDKDSSYPTFLSICSYLDVKSIIALSRTCKALSDLYKINCGLRWNINKDLKRFVAQPQHLRSELAKVNAIITGDFACQFFSREGSPATDLYIFIGQTESRLQENADVSNLTTYLEAEEGYELLGSGWESEDQQSCPRHKLILYRRQSPRLDGQVRIWLKHYESQGVIGSSLQMFLKTACCTSSMAFITHRKAYCLFPALKFGHPSQNFELNGRHYPCYGPSLTGEWSIDMDEIYTDIPCTQQSPPRPSSILWHPPCEGLDGLLKGPRLISDTSAGWIVDLDLDGIATSQQTTPDYVFDAAVFDIVYLANNLIVQSATRLVHPMLKYTFLTPPEVRLQGGSWTRHLKALLNGALEDENDSMRYAARLFMGGNETERPMDDGHLLDEEVLGWAQAWMKTYWARKRWSRLSLASGAH